MVGAVQVDAGEHGQGAPTNSGNADPATSCSVSFHGMPQIAAPTAPVLSAGYPDDPLFQSAKAFVQHHLVHAPVLGAI
jgi:hypothetical protein